MSFTKEHRYIITIPDASQEESQYLECFVSYPDPDDASVIDIRVGDKVFLHVEYGTLELLGAELVQ